MAALVTSGAAWPHDVKKLLPVNRRLQPLPLPKSRLLPACGFLHGLITFVSFAELMVLHLVGHMRFGKQSIGATSVKSKKTKLCVSGKARKQVMLNARRKA